MKQNKEDDALSVKINHVAIQMLMLISIYVAVLSQLDIRVITLMNSLSSAYNN